MEGMSNGSAPRNQIIETPHPYVVHVYLATGSDTLLMAAAPAKYPHHRVSRFLHQLQKQIVDADGTDLASKLKAFRESYNSMPVELSTDQLFGPDAEPEENGAQGRRDSFAPADISNAFPAPGGDEDKSPVTDATSTGHVPKTKEPALWKREGFVDKDAMEASIQAARAKDTADDGAADSDDDYIPGQAPPTTLSGRTEWRDMRSRASPPTLVVTDSVDGTTDVDPTARSDDWGQSSKSLDSLSSASSSGSPPSSRRSRPTTNDHGSNSLDSINVGSTSRHPSPAIRITTVAEELPDDDDDDGIRRTITVAEDRAAGSERRWLSNQSSGVGHGGSGSFASFRSFTNAVSHIHIASSASQRNFQLRREYSERMALAKKQKESKRLELAKKEQRMNSGEKSHTDGAEVEGQGTPSTLQLRSSLSTGSLPSTGDKRSGRSIVAFDENSQPQKRRSVGFANNADSITVVSSPSKPSIRKKRTVGFEGPSGVEMVTKTSVSSLNSGDMDTMATQEGMQAVRRMSLTELDSLKQKVSRDGPGGAPVPMTQLELAKRASRAALKKKQSRHMMLNGKEVVGGRAADRRMHALGGKDSFTSLSIYSKSYRWAQQVKKELGGSFFHRQVQERHETHHPPRVTYILTALQVFFMVWSLVPFLGGSIAPFGLGDEVTEHITVGFGNVPKTMQTRETKNIFFGPTTSTLIHFGACYPPCIKWKPKDPVNESLGCCLDREAKQCGDVGTEDCSSPRLQFRSTPCAETPLCQTSGFSIVLHPCCLGPPATCEMTTEEECAVREGTYSIDKVVCSEVQCMEHVCHFQGLPYQAWRFVTPLFIHVGVLHLIMNMLFQIRVGADIEALTGHWTFLAIYMFCGVGGNLVAALLTREGITTGASTALYGLIGVQLVDLRMSWPLIPHHERDMQLLQLVGLLLAVIGVGTFPNIDNWGHIGGIFFGALCGRAWLPSLVFVRMGEDTGEHTHSYSFRFADKKVRAEFIDQLFKNWFTGKVFLLLGSGILIFFVVYESDYPDACKPGSWCSYFNCIPYVNGMCP